MRQNKKRAVSINASNMNIQFVVNKSYRPSTISDLLLAIDFQKPVSCAADLKIINARLSHTSIHQLDARKSLDEKN